LTLQQAFCTSRPSNDDIRVYDTSTSPFTLTYKTGDIGDPAGLCIPGKDISYNPLHLTKDDGLDCPDEAVAPGGRITYRICYDNLGNSYDVHNVVITDTLPAGLSFVSATGNYTFDETTGSITWEIGTLPASSSGGCVQLVVDVLPSVTPETTIINSCTINSDDTPPTTQSDQTKISLVSPVEQMTVHPNPCDQGEMLTIANIPEGSKVYIYTFSGEKVRVLCEQEGKVEWDLTNTQGSPVARGIYFFYIDKTGKVGKIVVK